MSSYTLFSKGNNRCGAMFIDLRRHDMFSFDWSAYVLVRGFVYFDYLGYSKSFCNVF
jgi:hypothetical protein